MKIMAELEHAKRSLLQATYTPIKKNPNDEFKPKRTWEKWAFIASLQITLEEIKILRKFFISKPEDLNVVELIASTVPQNGTPSALNSAPLFRNVEPSLLVSIANVLIYIREEKINSITNTHPLILDAFNHGRSIATVVQPEVTPMTPPVGWSPVMDIVIPDQPESTVYKMEKIEELAPHRTEHEHIDEKTEHGKLYISKAMVVSSPTELQTTTDTSIDDQTITVKTLMGWAIKNNIEKDAATKTLELTKYMPLRAEDMILSNFFDLSSEYIDHLRNLVDGFKRRMDTEVVGYLHLERIGFTPAGIERGELIYSLPLAPGEEVNIAHKEWSNTSEEFDKIVTDYIEDFSEEGVTEKSEIAQSTNSQNQHSSGFNTGVTASGGYGPVNITASVSYNAADAASNSEQHSRNQSSLVTRKASSRSKKEHKISFKVASAAGTENQTVRKIKNPLTDKATRVDYYQLLRKWRVDLYRYGIRLTYDITIPEPGSDILSKINEIRDIQNALDEGFGSPNSKQHWASFDLQPSDITRYNYDEIAAKYNATVERPPIDPLMTENHIERDWTSLDQSRPGFTMAMELNVDDNYYVDQVTSVARSRGWIKGPQPEFYLWFGSESNSTYFMGKTGKLVVLVQGDYLSTMGVAVQLRMRLRSSAYKAWQLKAWNEIRDAAQARYIENRQMLKEKLAKLQEELGAQDALSLRKIEREEVMKGVLRWMLGPAFKFVPDIPENLYNNSQAVIDLANWSKVLAHGEFIKFLHHAIEWENMLYFLYPYFWSHTSRWELKKYLDHPDAMHKVFLKSGSARVVLTIRPGFEKDFVTLLEMGNFDALEPSHPYLTIAQEMENYAKTNYPGIRPANPVEGARPLVYPKQQKAWVEMQTLFELLDKYKETNGRYPTTAEGLRELQRIILPGSTVPTKDPWGNNYVYTSPGLYGDYDLVSYGADGKEGGTDENADITSWAESSLIGTWYDYTPTSAMDISFNEKTMPEHEDGGLR
jgi:hypothetical protein